MHFIPNPSNTEFVYLLGLEHVVDYLTSKDKKTTVIPPFRCAQCKIDFTPVWKWEKQGKIIIQLKLGYIKIYYITRKYEVYENSFLKIIFLYIL